MADYTLTYLLEIELEDGTRHKQNLLDHSVKTPPIQDENGDFQGKSWHADIREYKENLKIIRARLMSTDYLKTTIEVDLRTGIFTINGLSVLLEGEKMTTLPARFKLIYYRQVTRDRHVTVDLKEMKDIKTVDDPPFIEYFIGWETEIAGKIYQQKVAVA